MKEKEKQNTFYTQVPYPKKAHGVVTAVAKTRKITWRKRTWRVPEHRWHEGLACDLGLWSLKTGDHEEANLQNWFAHRYWSAPWLSFQMAIFKGILSHPCCLGPGFTFTISLRVFFFFCVGILKRALRLLLESMIPTCYYILLRVRFSTLKMKTQTNFLTWTRTFSYIHYCPISWTKVESNAHSHPPKETTRLCWLLGRSISFEDGLE